MEEPNLSKDMNEYQVEEENMAEEDLDDIDGAKKFLKKAFCLSNAGKKSPTEDFGKDHNSFLFRVDLEMDQDLEQEVYNFNHPKRGLAVIINNMNFKKSRYVSKKDKSIVSFDDRPGTSYDGKALHRSLKALGFDVELHDDLSALEMINVLKAASTNYDHSLADCFVCSILTHGDESWSKKEWDRMGATVRLDLLFGVDGRAVATKALVEMFNDENCSSLEHKPRLFFLQACRGLKQDDGHVVKVTKLTPALQKLGGGVYGRNGDAKDGTMMPLPPTNAEQQTSFDSSVDPPKYNQLSDSKDDQATPFSGDKDENDASGGNDMGENDGNDGFPGSDQEGGAGDDETKVEKQLPVSPASVYQDCLIMYAAPPGYFAWRRLTGSWFIQSLCKLFDSNVLDHVSLIRGLTRVCAKVAREYQTQNPLTPSIHRKKLVPVIESKLIKEVFMKRKTSFRN